MLFISCSNSLGIHSNGSSYPFKKSCQRLDKIVSCSNGSGYLSIKKKQTAIRMAWAIHSKKLLTVQAPGVICSMKNFSQVSIPKQFHCQPLLSNDLLFSRYSWVVKLRTLFTNASWIVTVPLLLLYSHLRYYNNYINYNRQDWHTFYSKRKFGSTGFVKIMFWFFTEVCKYQTIWDQGKQTWYCLGEYTLSARFKPSSLYSLEKSDEAVPILLPSFWFIVFLFRHFGVKSYFYDTVLKSKALCIFCSGTT